MNYTKYQDLGGISSNFPDFSNNSVEIDMQKAKTNYRLISDIRKIIIEIQFFSQATKNEISA